MKRLNINWPLFALGIALQAVGMILRVFAVRDRGALPRNHILRLIALYFFRLFTAPYELLALDFVFSAGRRLMHWLRR